MQVRNEHVLSNGIRVVGAHATQAVQQATAHHRIVELVRQRKACQAAIKNPALTKEAGDSIRRQLADINLEIRRLEREPAR